MVKFENYMRFKEAIKFIEGNKDKAAVAVNKEQMEIFILDVFVDDLESDTSVEDIPVSVSYEQDLGPGAGSEDFYEISECLEEHPHVEALEFFIVDKELTDSIRGHEFWYQLEALGL